MIDSKNYKILALGRMEKMMIKKMMIIKSFGAAIALGLLVTGPSAAVTPDGITPNDEVVCDGLKGATPGLYGLCVAYCEATDSPEDLTTEAKIASLPKPSAKLLAKYNSKRQDGDPQMPCATYYYDTACPAWSLEQINSVGTFATSSSESEIQERYDDEQSSTNDSQSLFDKEYLDNYPVRLFDNSVQVISYTADYYGIFRDIAKDAHTGVWRLVRNTYNTVALTEAEAEACKAEIMDHVMPTQAP